MIWGTPTARFSAHLGSNPLRRLNYEQLEGRAMLASVIATVELPPSTVEQFTDNTRHFIEHTLEKVLVERNQQPIGSSVESNHALADDGRPVRVTNFKIELMEAPATQAVSAASQLATGNNLTFTFLVFRDNSIRVRATLALPYQDLLVSAASVQTTSRTEPSTVKNWDWLSNTSFHANELSRQVPSRGGELQARGPGDHYDEDAHTERTLHNDSLAIQRRATDQLSEEDTWTIEFDESPTAPPLREGMLWLEFNQDHGAPDANSRRAADASLRPHDPTSNTTVQLPEEIELTDSLPVPAGMLYLELPAHAARLTPAEPTASDNSLRPQSSAMFQVFLQREDMQQAGKLPSETLYQTGLSALNQVRPQISEEGQGESLNPLASLAVLSLACGFWVSRRGSTVASLRQACYIPGTRSSSGKSP